MIGLDTNVLVRYLTQDDPEQAARATHIIEHELSDQSPGFIGLIVLAETVWVLQSVYRVSKDEVLSVVAELLGARTLVVESRDLVQRAIALARQDPSGFADALIAESARSAGCERVLSFDRGATGDGMTAIT